ncbi:MAG: L,D-transpeptidase family protein [Syntrophobacteraceae bacterium]
MSNLRHMAQISLPLSERAIARGMNRLRSINSRRKLSTGVKLLAVILGLSIALLWANHGERELPANFRADRVLVLKSERRLMLLKGSEPLKTYSIALGRNPIGHKEREGDGRTPEGLYRIDFRKADSAFHRALHISYPAPLDVESARARGQNPGGAIMIHGIRNGLGWIGRLHSLFDWTSGCIAVNDREIEELWRVVPDGTPVEIRP